MKARRRAKGSNMQFRTPILSFSAAMLAFAASLLAMPTLAQEGPQNANSDETKAEAVFPSGSTFGIVPFKGAVEAEQFAGFADLETSASVMINELPLDAWDEISEGFSKPETVAQAGIIATSINRLEIAGMEAIRIAGTQSKQGLEIPKCLILLKGAEKVGFLTAQIPFRDDFGGDACSMIKGIAQRDAGSSLDAKIAALPFALADIGSLRVVQVLGGSGLLLTRGPLDVVKSAEQPMMIAASSISANTVGSDQMAFSERALASFDGHELGKKLDSAEITLAGLPATRLVYEAVQGNGTKVTIVQWTAFRADGHYVRLIGIARREDWLRDSPSFERVANFLSFEAPSQ